MNYIKEKLNNYLRKSYCNKFSLIFPKLSPEEMAGCIIMIGILFVMGMGVFYRYILNNSLTWTEEVSRYGLVFLTFLGTSTAIKHENHIRIDIFDRFISGKLKILVGNIIDIITLIFLIILVYASIKIYPVLGNSKSSALKIPMKYLYISGVVGFTFSSIRLIIKMVHKNKTGGEK